MTGAGFMSLNNLKFLKLTSNACINRDFVSSHEITSSAEFIYELCGFNRTRSLRAKIFKVACESRHSRICWMDEKTSINAIGYRIPSPDDKIRVLMFNHNKAIRYLPVMIYRTFAGIEKISAPHCSIELIGRRNFMKLKVLQVIDLNSNQIERISGKTFKGLINLAEIDLSELKVELAK